MQDSVPDVRDLDRGEVVAEALVLVAGVPLAVGDIFGRQLPPPARRGLVVRGSEERLVGRVDHPVLVQVGEGVARAEVRVEERLIILINRAVLVVVTGREQEGDPVRGVLVPLQHIPGVVEDRADIRSPVLRVIVPRLQRAVGSAGPPAAAVHVPVA